MHSVIDPHNSEEDGPVRTCKACKRRWEQDRTYRTRRPPIMITRLNREIGVKWR